MPTYRADMRRKKKARKPPSKKKNTIDVDKSGGTSSTTDQVDTNIDLDVESSTAATTHETSSSAKKLKLDAESNLLTRCFMFWCYFIIDSRVMDNIVDVIGKCPNCNDKVKFTLDVENKRGLSNSLVFTCHNSDCDWKYSSWTSKEIEKKDGRGRRRFDINTRVVIAFREIGKAFAAILTFCGIMNMPPPMTIKSFQSIQNDNVIPSYKDAAEENMRSAAAEVRDGKDDITNTMISTDGTWQRRGFSSLNGVITIVAHTIGKVIDYRVLTKNCHSCKIWKGRQGERYEKFMQKHVCPINHVGPSGTMEMNGVLDCFKSSIENRKLRYLTYIGDGDSKSYTNVVKADPYPGYSIVKAECVGHIQKRCGKKLLDFKKDCKDLMPIEFYESEKNKKQKLYSSYLTHKQINKLQNYYGIAIRENSQTDVRTMRLAIGAVLFHCSDANCPESRHQFCPKGETSWCEYSAAQARGDEFTDKPGLPIPLRKKLEPIFRELSKPELLEKCLLGATQNNNESINGVIWTRCPKTNLVSRSVLEMAVSSAILSFNAGRKALYGVMFNSGLETGHFMESYCQAEDSARVFKANFKSTPLAKNKRKAANARKKGFKDKEDAEVITYAAEAF